VLLTFDCVVRGVICIYISCLVEVLYCLLLHMIKNTIFVQKMKEDKEKVCDN
jgi:hypothetical protein